MERWINSEVVYRGPIVSLRKGEAELDDGTRVHREVVEHAGGVAVLPELSDGRIVLVRQYRIAVQQDLLEIPAGRLESGETPAERAACELEEEVGYRAGRLELLSECLPSPGFTDQKDYIYLATDLTKTAQNLEFDERIEVVTMPLDEAWAMVSRGELQDAKTLIAVYALMALRQPLAR